MELEQWREKLLRGALIKSECTEKLAGINAEEKKSVEVQKVAGCHHGREGTRGRKQEEMTSRAEENFVESLG